MFVHYNVSGIICGDKPQCLEVMDRNQDETAEAA